MEQMVKANYKPAWLLVDFLEIDPTHPPATSKRRTRYSPFSYCKTQIAQFTTDSSEWCKKHVQWVLQYTHQMGRSDKECVTLKQGFAGLWHSNLKRKFRFLPLILQSWCKAAHTNYSSETKRGHLQ
jgi:hypothetical protein